MEAPHLTEALLGFSTLNLDFLQEQFETLGSIRSFSYRSSIFMPRFPLKAFLIYAVVILCKVFPLDNGTSVSLDRVYSFDFFLLYGS